MIYITNDMLASMPAAKRYGGLRVDGGLLAGKSLGEIAVAPAKVAAGLESET